MGTVPSPRAQEAWGGRAGRIVLTLVARGTRSVETNQALGDVPAGSRLGWAARPLPALAAVPPDRDSPEPGPPQPPVPESAGVVDGEATTKTARTLLAPGHRLCAKRLPERVR